jgi:hypothetical protein
MISAISAAPLAAVAALFSFLSLCVAAHINFIKPAMRRRKLKNCVTAYFIVPSFPRSCSYARQDNEEHRLKEISLKPNAEVVIDLILLTNVSFAFSEIQVGFMGQLEDKPHMLKYTNKFIRSGKNHEVDPSNTDTEDFIDINFSYHKIGDRSFSTDTTRSLAFTVKTNREGSYPLKIGFGSYEEIGVSASLYVKVEQNTSAKQKCVVVEHVRRGLECSRGIGAP